MIPPGLLNLDPQQDFQGMTTLMNNLLRSQGITAQTAQEEDCLYVLLEAPQVPEQQTMVSLVSLVVGSVDHPAFSAVRIYGRQKGDLFTDWSHEIILKRVEEKPDPGLGHGSNAMALVEVPLPKTLAGEEPTPQLLLEPAGTAPGTRTERFIVCGLGSLGQHCVASLSEFAVQEFAVSVTAIDREKPNSWEFEHLPALLAESLIVGDCRQNGVLERAGIHQCRTILIVTSDDGVNIETAIAARRMNPHIRLVVRSGKETLNELLKEKLGNFVALEPAELPAATFTLAALGEKTLGFFKVDHYHFRVVNHQVTAADSQFVNLPVYRLHKKNQRLLSYPGAAQAEEFRRLKLNLPETEAPLRAFHQWLPDTRVQVGESITYVEEVDSMAIKAPLLKPFFLLRYYKPWQTLQLLFRQDWPSTLARFWFWVYGDQTRRLLAFGSLTGVLLGILGAGVLKFTVPQMSWQSAISTAIILLLGGYGDVFGGLQAQFPLPWWAQIICLMITAFSLLFLLSLLGLVTDRILQAKFMFFQRRPPVPQANHVVLVGLGRIGKRIATLLHELQQPFVCLTDQTDQQDFMPNVPLVADTIARGLKVANLATAQSVILATDDQMFNLEAALTARDAAARLHREINLVIRTYDQRFSDHLAGLLPHARAFCAYALSAEAFVGAAFGENILSLFRLQDANVMVTEYQVEAGDTLHDRILAQVAYGYGVVPILHQAEVDGEVRLMPSDDVLLAVGDRLVVLATFNGLRRIERGVLAPCRRWRLQVLRPLDTKSLHYAGDALTNITGCSLATARTFMKNIPKVLGVPAVLEVSLYDEQAYRLVQKLRRLLPVRLISLPEPRQSSPCICIDWQTEQFSMMQN